MASERVTAPDRLTVLAAHLRDIAENATSGPWERPVANVFRVIAPEAENHEPRVGLTPPYPWRVICDMGGRAIEPDDAANASFIAALNPTVALALADVIDGIARTHYPLRPTKGATCQRCGYRAPCPEVTRWTPLADLLLGETA